MVSRKPKMRRVLLSKPHLKKYSVREIKGAAPNLRQGLGSDAPGAVTSPEFWTDLPFSYNETKLVLLVRDPEWAYSYWDFSIDTWRWIERFFQSDPKSRAILRIHNLDQNSFQDLDIDLISKNWYIRLGVPDTSFEVELGLIDSKGKFHLIAKSNRIRTPRNSPSSKIDPHWDARDFDEIYQLSGGGKTGHGSELFSRFKRPW